MISDMKRLSANVVAIASTLLMMGGCNSMEDALMDKTIEEAGSNAPEIKKALSAFDGKKADATEYLVRTMIGRNSITGAGLDSIEMLYLELPHKNGSWMFITNF